MKKKHPRITKKQLTELLALNSKLRETAGVLKTLPHKATIYRNIVETLSDIADEFETELNGLDVVKDSQNGHVLPSKDITKTKKP
jgi:hypothetical protein